MENILMENKMQVNWELEDCYWQKFHEIEDIKPQISIFEKRLQTFYKICGKLDLGFLAMKSLSFSWMLKIRI